MASLFETPEARVPSSRIRLRTPGDLQRAAEKCWRLMFTGELPATRGKALIDACSVLLRLQEHANLAERMEALEARLGMTPPTEPEPDGE
jgi:hypothetical protein